MPTYAYRCDKCGVRFERAQSFSAKPLTRCPECDGHVHRLIQPAGIVFKGSGWYVTENKKKDKGSFEKPE
jgi:putative FmdB family regulatory protein